VIQTHGIIRAQSVKIATDGFPSRELCANRAGICGSWCCPARRPGVGSSTWANAWRWARMALRGDAAIAEDGDHALPKRHPFGPPPAPAPHPGGAPDITPGIW